jgi:hypothetical protein
MFELGEKSFQLSSLLIVSYFYKKILKLTCVYFYKNILQDKNIHVVFYFFKFNNLKKLFMIYILNV